MEAEALHAFRPTSLQLLRPDGTLADVVEYGGVVEGATWSRYPVHGGGWQPNTPPTPGRFNEPAPSTPTPAQRATPPPTLLRTLQPAKLGQPSTPATASSQDLIWLAGGIGIVVAGGAVYVGRRKVLPN